MGASTTQGTGPGSAEPYSKGPGQPIYLPLNDPRLSKLVLTSPNDNAITTLTNIEGQLGINGTALNLDVGGNVSTFASFFCDNFADAQTMLDGDQNVLANYLQNAWENGGEGGPEPTDNSKLGGMFLTCSTSLNCCQSIYNISFLNPQGIFEFEIWDIPLYGVVDFTSFTGCVFLWFEEVDAGITFIVLKDLPNLETVEFSGNSFTDSQFSEIDMTGMINAQSIDFSDNNLSSTVVDTILNQVAASVVANPRTGSLSLQQQGSSPPTDASTDAITALTNAGWSLSYDGD